MQHPLIQALVALADDGNRAVLARLRRSLASHSHAEAFPFVAPFFPGTPDAFRERVLVLVAGLFSLHPESGSLSLARALRDIRNETGSDSIEQRFVALLASHADDVDDHLRHLVALAKAHDKRIDWNDLLTTLLAWNHPDQWAHRRWARDFWASNDHTEDSE
jgi:CRISPR system Cascade subunit CasB